MFIWFWLPGKTKCQFMGNQLQVAKQFMWRWFIPIFSSSIEMKMKWRCWSFVRGWFEYLPIHFKWFIDPFSVFIHPLPGYGTSGILHDHAFERGGVKFVNPQRVVVENISHELRILKMGISNLLPPMFHGGFFWRFIGENKLFKALIKGGSW